MAQAGDAPAFDDALFQQTIRKPNAAQIVFFLNVYWEEYKEQKDQFWQLFLKFDEQRDKFGAKENECPYPSFCKIMGQLEADQPLVSTAMDSYADRPSMSRRFGELGFKLRGDVSPLEACLFITGKTVQEVCESPQSPCDARLRAAQKALADLTAAREAEHAEKARLEAELEKHQNESRPRDAMKVRTQLNDLSGKIDQSEMQFKKDKKAAEKEITDAEAALAAENSAGTEAKNWLQGLCQANGKPFSAP